MALINFNQIKGGITLTDNVNEAVSKSAVINEWSETPSDDLIPSEALLESKVLTAMANKTVRVEEPVTITEPTTEIVLEYTPTDADVVLVVNGVSYNEGDAFTVDRATKTITWVGEFPLTATTVDSATVLYMTIKQNNGSSNGTSFPKAKHIVGMVLAEEGSHNSPTITYKIGENTHTAVYQSAKGDWRRIDQNYNEVDFDPNHGTWAGIQEVTTNLSGLTGRFVEIPTTWVKNEVLQSGPYAGCHCWWMADGEAPGFHVHPAFIKPDGTPGKLRVGKYMTSVPEDEYGGGPSMYVQNNDEYIYFYLQTTTYGDLRDKAFAYNTDDEDGYRAYSIYDHHFIARMILTEFGDPNIFFKEDSGKWYEDVSELGLEMDTPPSEAQQNIPKDYHGIKCLLGDAYASCLLDGLTTLNGTYQLLAADGSGTMVETGVPCSTKGTWMTNCYMTKVNGVDFGDVFINDGRNLDDVVNEVGVYPGDLDNNSAYNQVHSDENFSNVDHVMEQGSFCDYQYILPNRAVYTQYEAEYTYCGIFMLNSIDIDSAGGGGDTYMCWRLVQVV